MTQPLDASTSDIYSGAPTFSLANRLERLAFIVVWRLFAAWTPRQAKPWRSWILRRFGADIAATANVYGSARIWLPRNLTMDDYSIIGPGVEVYSMAPIRLGKHVIVSQRAHLCCGSHDIGDVHFQLRAFPIEIGDDAWICAEAFVGPRVKVGKGAVLAARGAAFTDLDDWMVYRGNPAQSVKSRPRFERGH